MLRHGGANIIGAWDGNKNDIFFHYISIQKEIKTKLLHGRS